MAKPAGNQRGGTPSPDVVEEKVIGYIDRLAEVLAQCANDMESRPEAFLWGARRSLEAILSAVNAKDGSTKTSVDLTVGQLLEQFEKREGLIDRDIVGALRALQVEGNYGTHLQSHEPMACSEPVERCRPALAHAVKWFFERSNVGEREIPPKIQAALDVIAKKAPSPARVERERAEEAKESATREITRLRKNVAGANEELEQARDDATKLRRRIADLESGRGRAPRTVEEPAEATSAPGALGRVVAPALIVIAILAAAAGVWAILRSGPADQPATTTPVLTMVSPTPSARGSDVAPPGDDGGAAPPAIPVVPAIPTAAAVTAIPSIDAGAEAAHDCRVGMIWIKGRPVSFGEPYPRPWLKAPKETGLSATVASFCIDITAVTAKDFAPAELAAADSSGFKGSGCLRSGSALRNCVNQIEAARHCAGRGARLPKLVEWELVASVGADKRLNISREDREWVDDPFPSPEWGRGPPQQCDDKACFLVREKRLTDADAPAGAARYSWMRRPNAYWAGDLVFRCARDPE